ncbi:MAG: hypothetical protein ACRD4S_17220 [Candidatus Acidiferrales bacterium]
MKTRTALLTLATLFAAVVVCFAAADVNMGAWNLNEAKSKLGAGGVKNTTVVYAPDGDTVKVTVDGVDADGKPVHSEWTGKFDGKDYPVTGDPAGDTRSYRRISSHTMTFTGKKDGKINLTGRIVVSPSGKSRTITVRTTDAKGNKITSVAVYDKQ